MLNQKVVIMKAFEVIERLELVHKLISEKRTGTPDELATRLGIKRRALYDLVNEMKSRGAPVLYSRSAKTFYYERPVTFAAFAKFSTD
jgi:Predicted transcriptional regulator